MDELLVRQARLSHCPPPSPSGGSGGRGARSQIHSPHCGEPNQPACYSKFPQPFKNHPDLDLYLGGSSAHPIDKVGCTVCHEGMGQSVSFRDGAHTPSDKKQQEEWEKKYGWEQPHLWDYPMLPLKMTEAACAKCHKQNVYVPHADALNIAKSCSSKAVEIPAPERGWELAGRLSNGCIRIRRQV